MKRRLLLQLGLTTWSLPLRAQPGDAQLVAVRVWPSQAYTRVTLESDRLLAATHFVTHAPERLVIDIDGLSLSNRLRELVAKPPADDPYIAGVRVGQYQPRVVRLVFDLKQGVAPQVFTLAPVAAYQHRLVLDLYAAQPKDPLAELIAEREANAQQAVGDVNDALGDWLQRREAERAQAPVSASQPAPPPAPQPTAPKPPAAPKPASGKVARLRLIALDPGHGGEDPGAIGPSGLREKDVVLSIAQQLRDRLLQEPNMRVLMTRDADYFVPLHERVRKARRVGADLFVSIHADAFLRPEARGASVFALSTGAASSAAARWMAQRENQADAVGGLNIRNVKDSAVLRAMADMSTTAQIRDSLQLGSQVLGQLGRVGRLHKPRVEQAGFAVLKAPDIPSILVETAFISNPEEEKKLRDPSYQAQLVDALAKGLMRHLNRRPGGRVTDGSA
ncbi:MAG: N-acetylmuramoyl-L-alanine amidase [Inhella sp.]|jgi:N-acetylmuramoyl-L-alanine amidase|uniref:N-acetylmuramoyl-L-alanine amidase n=1 Tax=Inhella sp. TaxID=1921806 RepID=UPI0022C5ACC7|nr:N-acetylmuramoyl-L-alanine amidase [Inhella sp.]MCZ8235858.1 N-acetylmuramoyl-L-alanine amidase [Inhella sp.]